MVVMPARILLCNYFSILSVHVCGVGSLEQDISCHRDVLVCYPDIIRVLREHLLCGYSVYAKFLCP